MRVGRRNLIELALCALLVAPAAVRAQGIQPLTVLEVPFLAQSELLCGGAAAAMVLRYWGSQDAHAEEFASFVDPAAGGIRGDALVGALRSRGWFAQSLRGTAAIAQAHLARGRPLVTLIEDRPGSYHYVVPVAWHEGTVLVHDPAHGPFRVLEAATFMEAWSSTGFWTLLVLPGTDSRELPPGADVGASRSETTACGDALQRAVALVQAGDHSGAEAVLRSAGERCSESGAVNRERAGLRYLASDWAEAVFFAERAVRQTPSDAHAWRVLAASRFMSGDQEGALEAWNAIGEPRLDRVRLDPLGWTNAIVARRLVDLVPGSVVTPQDLRRARRRLNSLPGVSTVRVGYVPGPAGAADVDVALRTRGRLLSLGALVGGAAHAITAREVRLDHQIFSGSDVHTRLSWRWWESRPRVAVGLHLPRAFGHLGLWSFEAAWERQAYATRPGSGGQNVSQESHRSLAVRYADWTNADTWTSVGIGLQRWSAAGSYLTFSGAMDRRLAGDRLSVQLGASWSPPLTHAVWFGRTDAMLAWRSSTSARGPTLAARAGVEIVTQAAPVDTWPRAGVGHSGSVLMRAHPLLEDGVAGGPLLGHRLAHTGIEVNIPVRSPAPVRMSLAVFGDAGRTWRALDGDRTFPTQVDVGVGVVVNLSGVDKTLRIDFAHGLQDGARAVSARWQLPWPRVDH